ncbi:cation diffusion facilitator family transporter [Fictibacillus macauensis ZFHKF-1]|uniref:Cation diffusion facilitator family transporter n=1 Tax=Fictibacillus macauensis ZFHKF-1 TaxID=1196324 RepID=I8UI13_9BACL|nr:cation diffusion facilitator family transporter [Fictibacillus macauensis]EIT86448.1 cation diffusion facilitator family transporter [Fictibacillus macauensis ZFHKF-1]
MAHHHDHHHHPTHYGKAFAVGIVLNTLFIIIEVIYGITADSLALLADAGHNLSDVLGLAIAWIAVRLGNALPTKKHTWGLKKSSVMAALLNALLLLVAIGAIAWEAIQRFWQPAPVAGVSVMIVAGIGILINGFTAVLFMSGSKKDLNIKGAYLHMAADAIVSAGVVVAGAIIYGTGLTWLDPIVSLLIAIVIFTSTWSLLKESIHFSLDAVPEGIQTDDVLAYLRKQEGVLSVHDLHIWGMSTTETALSVHIVLHSLTHSDMFLKKVTADLHDRFNIEHATIQLETNSYSCSLEDDHKV